MRRKASFKNMPKLQAKKFARLRHEQKRQRRRGKVVRETLQKKRAASPSRARSSA